MDMPTSSSMPSSSSMMSPQPQTMMTQTFFTSTSTPLYSLSWSPASTAAYAGTCIFLIVLAVAFRGLLAVRAGLERKWVALERRRVLVVAGAGGRKRSVGSEISGKDGLPARREREGVRDGGVRPWRISQDGVRSVVDVGVAGVGYLLMLAVMTYNVGYFLSVLAGVWIGSLVFGRWSAGGGGLVH